MYLFTSHFRIKKTLFLCTVLFIIVIVKQKWNFFNPTFIPRNVYPDKVTCTKNVMKIHLSYCTVRPCYNLAWWPMAISYLISKTSFIGTFMQDSGISIMTHLFKNLLLKPWRINWNGICWYDKSGQFVSILFYCQ